MISIGNFKINNNSPVFIIAELSANHNHDIKIAIETIKKAKRAGANAIKLQTYTADTLTINCDNDYFKIGKGTLWDGKTLYELYEEAFTPWEWHQELFKVANEEGLECFSSPFDFTSVDFLDQFNPPAFKIASFEIQDIPLINYVAKRHKPIIISTGIATEQDVELAIQTCFDADNHDVILLKCTSAYPAPVELANLLTIPYMKQKFGTEVGLSDHTLSNTSSIVSVALGAKVIEKHFILDKNIGGPDAAFSLNPSEFEEMVIKVREAESALGKPSFEISEKVENNRQFAKSLFVVEDIKKGDFFTSNNVRSIRPGFGLHPKFYYEVLGKMSTADISRGTPLKFEFVSNL
jgi:pseudaminic acid synthase